MTGNGVTDASMPGRWAAPPAPAMITRSPRLAPRYHSDHLVRHPVRGHHVHLVADPELRHVLAADSMTGQSESLPMTTPTRVPLI